MKILGIESATAVCGAALTDRGIVLSERQTEQPRAHSEQLLALVGECMRTGGTSLQDLDGIAVSIGPGSFTGLRIGLSVAKGLAFAGEKPIVGVGTLEALAYRAIRSGVIGQHGCIAPVIDARRDEIYAALYRAAGDHLTELLPPRAVLLRELADLLPSGERILLLGDGAEKTYRYFESVLPSKLSSVTLLPADQRGCSAVAVALLAERRLSESGGDDLAALEPAYGKEFFTLLRHQHSPVS